MHLNSVADQNNDTIGEMNWTLCSGTDEKKHALEEHLQDYWSLKKEKESQVKKIKSATENKVLPIRPQLLLPELQLCPSFTHTSYNLFRPNINGSYTKTINGFSQTKRTNYLYL